MNIAIIGAGTAGRAPATSATRAGHTATVSDRDPQEAQAVAQAAGARAARSNAEAIRAADAVIPAVSFLLPDG